MRYGRKITGGMYHKQKKKKLYEIQSQETHVVLGETSKKQIKTMSGKIKTIMLRENKANLLINGKIQRVEIKNVVETPQKRFLARQNRLMKGAIIETEKGKARITNRPSQEGQVNAVLIEQ